MLQKRKEREAAVLKNTKFTEDHRKKWLGVISNDFMSSEDSDDEAIVVHPLPWRSDYVNQMFQKIDDYSNSKKSPQARRQMKERIYGRPSHRPRVEAPEWAVRKT